MDKAIDLWSFRRATVADQALVVLRQAIQEGTLGDPLPGENQLARSLGISRPSLRTALTRLADEGFITRCNGRRSRIAFKGQPEAQRAASQSVHLVCPISRESFALDQHPILLHMHAYFATKGIGWTETYSARLDVPNPARQLRALVANSRNACWLLVRCTRQIHDWFARANVPALVLGSTHPGIDLPSVDIDYRAIGWHAAGNLVRHGHRQVALLAPERLYGGDLDSCGGFLDYIAKKASDTIVTRIGVLDDQSDLPARLERVMRARRRPTALFCTYPAYTLSAMVTLLRAGWRIPEDVSLVSRDSSTLIEIALPEIARYKANTNTLADRAAKLVQSALAGHRAPEKPALVTPTFIPGSTLATAPT